MQAVYNNDGELIGDVDKAFNMKGWFATVIDKTTLAPMSESFFVKKSEAIQYVIDQNQTLKGKK